MKLAKLYTCTPRGLVSLSCLVASYSILNAFLSVFFPVSASVSPAPHTTFVFCGGFQVLPLSFFAFPVPGRAQMNGCTSGSPSKPHPPVLKSPLPPRRTPPLESPCLLTQRLLIPPQGPFFSRCIRPRTWLELSDSPCPHIKPFPSVVPAIDPDQIFIFFSYPLSVTPALLSVILCMAL